jgi:prepilin-type processing-associated H-X9-DG protein
VIEVLALGATMVVLAALLMPGLAQSGNPFERAREAARRASCRSNLKQLSVGILMYTQDYDEKYPIMASARVSASTPPYRGAYGWADAIWPYVRASVTYQCPTEVNGPNVNAVKPGFVDYYYNANLNQPLRSRTGQRTRRVAVPPLTGVDETSLTAPAHTVLLGEGMNGDARYHRTSTESDPHANSGKPNASAPNRIHDGSANYLMADGHVLGLNASQVYGGAQPARDKQPGSPMNLGRYTATHLIR